MPVIVPVTNRIIDGTFPTNGTQNGPNQIVHVIDNKIVVLGSGPEHSGTDAVPGDLVLTRIRIVDRTTGQATSDFNIVDVNLPPSINALNDPSNYIRSVSVLSDNSLVIAFNSVHPTLVYPGTTHPVGVHSLVFVTDIAAGTYNIVTPFEPDPLFPGSYSWSTVIELANGNIMALGNQNNEVLAQVYNPAGVEVGNDYQFLSDANAYVDNGDGTWTQRSRSEFGATTLSDGRTIFTFVEKMGIGDFSTGDITYVNRLTGVFAAADGTTNEVEFQVSSDTSGDFQIWEHQVVAMAGGGFLVAWTDIDWTNADANQNYNSTLSYGIFNSSGVLQGSYVALDTSSGVTPRPSEIFFEEAVVLPNGMIALIWNGGQEGHSSEDAPTIALLDASGNLIGTPFALYDSHAIRDYVYDLDVLPNGNLILYSLNFGVVGGSPSSSDIEYREFVVAQDTPASNDDDVLAGTAGDDVISALAGADRIYALAGNDTINGGAGDDHIYAQIADAIDGGADYDTLHVGNTAFRNYDMAAHGIEAMTATENGNNVNIAYLVDGSISENAFDTANTQTYDFYSNTYTSNWVLALQQFIDDNGNSRNIGYDLDNTEVFQYYQNTYNSSGQLVTQEILDDNGNQRVVGYDVDNVETFASYVNTYDTQNRLILQQIEDDNGNNRVIGYDVDDLEPWTYYQNTYNPAGDLIDSFVV